MILHLSPEEARVLAKVLRAAELNNDFEDVMSGGARLTPHDLWTLSVIAENLSELEIEKLEPTA
jgi:hypothetical protein